MTAVLKVKETAQQQAASAAVTTIDRTEGTPKTGIVPRVVLVTGASSGLGGILHCFTGSAAEAQAGLDMGFMISFAGNATYPKTQNLRDVARDLPLESMFIETDSPFLAPQGHRGKRNEPALVAEVARVLASVRKLPTEDFAAATAANFRRFFRLQRAV